MSDGKLTKFCSVDDCQEQAMTRGWCSMHYGRWRRHGDPLTVVSKQNRKRGRGECKIDGCNAVAHSLGLCRKHYTRVRRYGDPLTRRRIANGEALAFLMNAIAIKSDECILWPFSVGDVGYGTIHYKGSYTHTHRLALILATGNPPFPNAQAAHECGVRLCVNVRHLSWKTNRENSLDRRKHGTMFYGEDVCQGKLNSSDVVKIREMHGTGEYSYSQLAALFNVHAVTIGQIIRNETWKSVT